MVCEIMLSWKYHTMGIYLNSCYEVEFSKPEKYAVTLSWAYILYARTLVVKLSFSKLYTSVMTLAWVDSYSLAVKKSFPNTAGICYDITTSRYLKHQEVRSTHPQYTRSEQATSFT